MERFFKNGWFVALCYLLLGLTALYLMFKVFPIFLGLYNFLKAVLAPFFIAMIISYLLNPIVNLLNRRKVPRTIAILLIYALFFMMLTVIFMNITPMFIKQLIELNEHIPDLMRRTQLLLDGFNRIQSMPDSVRLGIQSSMMKWEINVSLAIAGYING